MKFSSAFDLFALYRARLAPGGHGLLGIGSPDAGAVRGADGPLPDGLEVVGRQGGAPRLVLQLADILQERVVEV